MNKFSYLPLLALLALATSCKDDDNGPSFTYPMVKVDGGTFTMGCTSEQSSCFGDESPTHEVTLSTYYIGETEITQKQWKEVMGDDPSYHDGCDDCPVEQVSWEDAIAFCNALSEKEGKTPYYETDGTVNVGGEKGYRLPTEAQWEFAARGGTKATTQTLYSGSNNLGEVGWYYVNSGSETHPVKTKKANALGVYDMSGNVLEWCYDWYGNYSSSSQTDPDGPNSSASRVLRGGSWAGNDRDSRVAVRGDGTPTYRNGNFGFRLALVP